MSRAFRGGMRLRIRVLSWFRGVNLTVILGNFGGNLVLIGLSLLRKRQVCSSVPGWLAAPGSISAPDGLDDPVSTAAGSICPDELNLSGSIILTPHLQGFTHGMRMRCALILAFIRWIIENCESHRLIRSSL